MYLALVRTCSRIYNVPVAVPYDGGAIGPADRVTEGRAGCKCLRPGWTAGRLAR